MPFADSPTRDGLVNVAAHRASHPVLFLDGADCSYANIAFLKVGRRTILHTAARVGDMKYIHCPRLDEIGGIKEITSGSFQLSMVLDGD